MKAKLAIACATAFLAGCVSSPLGKQVGDIPPSGNQSEVFIYRPKDNAVNYFEALISGKKASWNLKNGGVIIEKVPAGDHTFRIQSADWIKRKNVESNTVQFRVEAGKRVYIRAKMTGGHERILFVSGRHMYSLYYVFTSEVVSEETAQSEARDLHYVW